MYLDGTYVVVVLSSMSTARRPSFPPLSPLFVVRTHIAAPKSFVCRSYPICRGGRAQLTRSAPRITCPPTPRRRRGSICNPLAFINLQIPLPATPLFSHSSALPGGWHPPRFFPGDGERWAYPSFSWLVRFFRIPGLATRFVSILQWHDVQAAPVSDICTRERFQDKKTRWRSAATLRVSGSKLARRERRFHVQEIHYGSAAVPRLVVRAVDSDAGSA
jgi:hypothetical protein